MKLIEEKQSVKLQILSLVFLFGSTVLMSYSDYEIQKFNSSNLIKIFSLLNTMQIDTALKIEISSDYFKKWLVLGKLSEEEKAKAIEFHYSINKMRTVKDSETSELVTKLKNGEINLSQYYSRIMDHQNRKSIALNNEYNQEMVKLNDKLRRGTFWYSIKSISYIIQILSILVLVFGHYKLMKDISERFEKKESSKRSEKTALKT